MIPRAKYRLKIDREDARRTGSFAASLPVFMTNSLRSAAAFLAALAVTAVAPAQAGVGAGQPQLLANAAIPPVAVPDLLASEAEPKLSGEEPGAAPSETPAVATPEAESAAPAVKPSGDLPAMIAQLGGTDPGSRELECLATGVYIESKSEPLAGQLAVGHVIANRAKSGRFPTTYCGVLFQRGQFSFVRGKSLPSVPRSSKQWKTAVAIAKIVDQGLKDSSVGKALFFHAKRVSPRWRLKRVAAIGNHIFYR